MIRSLLFVGGGGALGSMARYAVSMFINSKFNLAFPLGTFIINVVGCFIIGILFALALKQQWTSNDVMLFTATGFCGGFTTFSTFAMENLNLLNKQQSSTAFFYSIISLILGILLCKLGFVLGEKL